MPPATATPTTPPVTTSAPNLWVASATSSTVSLGWTAVPGATSYVVYRVTPYTPAPVIGMYSGGATVLGLSPGTSYAFQVNAVDAAGNRSAPSNIVTASTAP